MARRGYLQRIAAPLSAATRVLRNSSPAPETPMPVGLDQPAARVTAQKQAGRTEAMPKPAFKPVLPPSNDGLAPKAALPVPAMPSEPAQRRSAKPAKDVAPPPEPVTRLARSIQPPSPERPVPVNMPALTPREDITGAVEARQAISPQPAAKLPGRLQQPVIEDGTPSPEPAVAIAAAPKPHSPAPRVTATTAPLTPRAEPAPPAPPPPSRAAENMSPQVHIGTIEVRTAAPPAPPPPVALPQAAAPVAAPALPRLSRGFPSRFGLTQS